MTDYNENIDINDYLYNRVITVTEMQGLDQLDVVAKLELNSSNFNFNLSTVSGIDFRLSVGSIGGNVLNMWIESWDYVDEEAIIWFKLPLLLSNEEKTLYAFWGNSTVSGISDISSVFIFGDDFLGNSLDTDKWTLSGGAATVEDSRVIIPVNQYIEVKDTPLNSVTDWILTDSLDVEEEVVITSYSRTQFQFYGDENDFGIYFYGDGDSDRRHNFETNSLVYDDGVGRGFESESSHYITISYDESTDTIKQGISSRNTLADYLDDWERSVNGDTLITYFRIYGYTLHGPCYIYHNYVFIRRNLGDYDPIFDTDNLYVGYEQINPPALSTDLYGSNIVDTIYYHESDFGGNVYMLSDGSCDSVWSSSDGGAAEDGVGLIIDFGRGVTNLVSDDYNHYDDGHVVYFAASKLSDSDEDINNNSYYNCTTTSGYVAIDFENNRTNVGCLSVKAVSNDLDAMAKNFIFAGSNYNPRLHDNYYITLCSGIFNKTSDWQIIHTNNTLSYRYFKLTIHNTYGSNIKIQEWQMSSYEDGMGKKIISKLRLKPFVDFQYFPKQIKLYGYNDDGLVTLIEITNTYTPTDLQWQEYVFYNIKGYWYYKLECIGNWNNNSGKIEIAEWEMYEKASENNIYRILSGTTNNCSNVWADSNCTFEQGNFYVINNVINTISDRILTEYEVVTGDIKDINVV